MAKGDMAQGFGSRLAELRKAAGYTQTQLADALGISQRMVAYYESIEDNPLVRILLLLSETLGVSADELLGTAPVRPATRRKLAARARTKRTGNRRK